MYEESSWIISRTGRQIVVILFYTTLTKVDPAQYVICRAEICDFLASVKSEAYESPA